MARHEAERTLFNIIAFESDLAQARAFPMQELEKRFSPLRTLKLGEEPQF